MILRQEGYVGQAQGPEGLKLVYMQERPDRNGHLWGRELHPVCIRLQFSVFPLLEEPVQPS